MPVFPGFLEIIRVVNSNNDNHNRILNDYRKVAAIVLSVIFVLLIVVIVIVAKSNEPIKINLNDYISNNICTDQNIQTDIDCDDEYDQRSEVAMYYSNYTEGPGLRIYGYNQYASLETSDLKNIIDWDSLKRDIDEQLSHKRKYEKRYLDFYDFFDVDSFDFSVDNSDNISNGDSVCVTVNTKESYMFNNVTIEFSGCSYTYEIDGLKTVKAFDPFDYVTFIHDNANGYASAGCRVNEDLNENIEELDGFKVTYYSEDTIAIEKDDYIIAKIKFYFDDDTNSYHNYKNGETVTMYCSCSNYNLTDEYDIYIGVSQKEYTFSNLGNVANESMITSANEGVTKYKQEDGHFELKKQADATLLSAIETGEKADVKQYYLDEAKKKLDKKLPKKFKEKFDEKFPDKFKKEFDKKFPEQFKKSFDKEFKKQFEQSFPAKFASSFKKEFDPKFKQSFDATFVKQFDAQFAAQVKQSLLAQGMDAQTAGQMLDTAVAQAKKDGSYKKAYDSAYSKAYAPAYKKAYDSAYSSAYYEAHDKAYSEAYDKAYDEAYDKAYKKAYDKAYKKAYKKAYDKAYKKAYDKAWKKAQDKIEDKYADAEEK